MTDATGHLPYWTLEQLAENELPHAERTLAEQHVRGCERCAAELDSARALVAALEALPRFEPSPTFADAVMARVVVAPAPSAALEPAAVRVRRWLPKTGRGWMTLGWMVLLPLLPLLTLGFWLFRYPGVSAASLWGMSRGWLMDVAWRGVVETTGALVRSGAVQAVMDVFDRVPDAALSGVPLALIAFAAAIPVSAWMMYHLLRTPTGGMTHAH